MDQEIWKDVVGYEGLYQVSNFGRIKSLESIYEYMQQGVRAFRKKKELIVKQVLTNSGYYVTCLHKKGKLRQRLTHRLVAQAFIPNTENKPQINHIDGNKLNKRVENLEWSTGSENIIHAHKTGLFKNQKPIIQLKDGIVIACYESIADINRKTGFTRKNVRNALNGKTSNSHGYQWEYKKER